MMTWEKFGAKSPQFADVGNAIYDAWFVRNEKGKFSEDDKDALLQWMWHNERAFESEVALLKKEILDLKFGKSVA